MFTARARRRRHSLDTYIHAELAQGTSKGDGVPARPSPGDTVDAVVATDQERTTGERQSGIQERLLACCGSSGS